MCLLPYSVATCGVCFGILTNNEYQGPVCADLLKALEVCRELPSLTMDYEIDIEEHDVLDNPIIKTIFPDISVIKKEITQYYDEETTTKEEANVTEIQPNLILKSEDLQSIVDDGNSQNISVESNCHPTKGEKEKSQHIQSNKIILGTKSKPVGTESAQNNNKKLILGSKPLSATNNEFKTLISDYKPNEDLQIDNIVHNITDSKSIDDNTQNETKVKLILGSKPCTTSLNDSEKVDHDKKIKFKEMKLVLRDIKSYLNQNGRYCKQCCRLFLSKTALDTHRNKMHHNKILCKNKNVIEINTSKSVYKCSICGICISSNSNLLRHYRNIHKKNIKLRNRYKSTPNNNVNVMKTITNKKKQKIAQSNKCNICSVNFSTHGSFARHFKNKHKSTANNINSKHEIVYPIKYELHSNSDSNEKNEISTDKSKHVISAKKRVKTAFVEEKNKAISSKTHKDITILEKRKQTLEFAKECKENDSTQKKHKAMKNKHKESFLVNSMDYNSETPSSEDNVNPKYETRSKSNNSTKDSSNVCLHCNKEFSDQKSLIEHMYDVLDPKRNTSESILTVSTKKEVDKVFHTCRQCSYYLTSVEAYFAHLRRNHKTESFLEVHKEVYNPQCKYCPYKSSNVTTHNRHIHSYHINLMFSPMQNEIENGEKVVRKNHESIKNYNENSFALESVLFECNKCSICFFSSDKARDHKKHSMEESVNWKCSICDHVLKKQDKEMHLKQHSFSQPLKVYNLNETALENVLYNCTKCAIHFTEKRYYEHFPHCGSDTTDATYCSTCDILVDKMEIIHHKSQHKLMNDIFDFTIIDSNIILDSSTSLKRKGAYVDTYIIKTKKRFSKQSNCLTYCPTCKSFLSNSGLNNKSHIKGACSRLHTFPCDVCGLVFTSSTLQIHKERHEKEKDLRLQDFKFFDLQGVQVLPTIPEYPHCKICKIHFIRKIALSRHICDETECLTCDICNIKLSEQTFKLHMAFHFYVIHKTSIENDRSTSNEKLRTDLPNASTKNHEIVDSPTSEKISLQTDLVEDHNNGPVSKVDSLIIIYTCKSCDMGVQSYDEVINHCQIHYSGTEIKKTSVEKCKQCSVKFDSRSFLEHQSRAHSGVSKIQVLKFDPSCFTSKNIVWVKHVFQTLPKEMVKELLKFSIYKHEHRIRLECIQKGSMPFNIYKCGSCGNCIDPGNLYGHAESPCGNVRKYPCALCGLPFISIFSRSNHENQHKQIKGLNKKSLNIVLFNQSKDKTFNGRIFGTANQYLLYQCRNCNRVAEKLILSDHVCDSNTLIKCLTCGLLIGKEDFEAHSSNHKKLGNFSSENFKVILFGRKSNNTHDNEVSKSISPCFSGTVYDYTMYTCEICKMCLKNNENTERHTCIPNFDLDRSICPECDLNFPSGNMRHHMKQHKTDPDFLKENMNVISFNNSLNETGSFSTPKNETGNMTLWKENQADKFCEYHDMEKNDIEIDGGQYKKYKPTSTLEKSTKNNINDISQRCDNTKKNENNVYGIDEDVAISHEMDHPFLLKVRNVDEGHTESDNTAEKIVDAGIADNVYDDIETLYKSKCGLHFLSKQRATEHSKKCYPKMKQHVVQNCAKCHLLFNPSELFSHLLVHHKDKAKVYSLKIIEVNIDKQ